MPIRQAYAQKSQQAGFQSDPMQWQVVEILQQTYQRLAQPPSHAVNGPPLSLYLWGKVGRGKSLLMDLFYQCVVDHRKRRVHFYRFMQNVHRRLAAIAGCQDPLIVIADEIAAEVKVLCFDEFFVSDIGDAMLLSGLLGRLFEQGVVILITSNVEPARLYENGLQRQRFLPCIAAIQANMQQIHVNGSEDHRLRALQQSPSYFINDSQAMFEQFVNLCGKAYASAGELILEHRPVNYQFRSRCHRFCWFDFSQLCLGPRSQNDYIALANLCQHVFVDNVPQMGGKLTQRSVAQGTEDRADGQGLAQFNRQRQQILQTESISDDQARRFIALVDEFYDRKVQLYIGAEVAVNQLYLGGRLTLEFERTVSRLIEMQSLEYADLSTKEKP